MSRARRSRGRAARDSLQARFRFDSRTMYFSINAARSASLIIIARNIPTKGTTRISRWNDKVNKRK